MTRPCLVVPRLPEGSTRQLWVLHGGSARSAGVLGRGGELGALVEEMEPTDALVEEMEPTDALALTVEPEGSSTAPTGGMVLRIRTT